MRAIERRRDLAKYGLQRSTLSIDPGSKGLAWAEWSGGNLFAAGLSRTSAEALEDRALDHSRPFTRERFDIVVLERMTHYPNAKARDAKANDLLDLQMIGATVAGRVLSMDGSLVYARAPEWKGQVPKEIMRERIFAALDNLEKLRLEVALEKVPKSLQHNVYDAIGIGLWFFSRLP